MFCQACGADNSADARFCNMCGTAIAQPGTPGGMVADGTVKGTGSPLAEPAPAPDLGIDSTVRAPDGAGPAGEAAPASTPEANQGVWGSAGASMAGQSYGRPMGGGGASVSGIGNATLAGVGVQSSRRAWTVIVIVALVLVGLGVAAGWALSPGEAEPEDYDPAVAENQAEIGMPLPEGVDMPEGAAFDGVPSGGDTSMSSGSGMASSSSSMGGGGGRHEEEEAPTTTVIATSMGTTTMAGSGSGTSTNTTTSSGTGMGTTAGTGTSSAMSSGSGSGSGTGTGTGMGTGTGTGTGMGTGGGGSNTVPDDAPEERDIALSMYSQRVRFVIARYYASRAQTCFDLATRNNPELTGEVRIRLTIGTDGQVTNATPAANTTGNPTLAQCLAGRVSQWRLPPPPDGELTLVLPFRN